MDENVKQMLDKFRVTKAEFDEINQQKKAYFEKIWLEIMAFLRQHEALPMGYDRLLRIKRMDAVSGWVKESITMEVIRNYDSLYNIRIDRVEVFRKSVHIYIHNVIQSKSGVIYLPFKYFDRFSVEYIAKKFEYELKLQKAIKDRPKGVTKTAALIAEYEKYLELKDKFENNKKYAHFVKKFGKKEAN